MKKNYRYLSAWLLSMLLTAAAFSQVAVISGNVRNSSSKETLGAVSITVKGVTRGTYTDDKGNFKFTVKNLPVTLIISSIGYESKELVVSSENFLQIDLSPSSSLGQEVIVSATRLPQKLMESPVSVERVSSANLRNAPIANYYDIVKSLKGVDVTTSSLTFTTPTTRGFNSSGNTRFNQLVDGMDNQAPGLNFSVASIIGLSELDVDNMELLSGASSALYGSGGMTGTLLITSKNPFKYQGLSFNIKQGIMHIGDNENGASQPATPYYNWNFRWAKKVSEKFAFKINGELIQAKDWLAGDSRNYRRTGTTGTVTAGDRKTDPNYDGVNVYGDETTVDIRPFLQAFAAATGNTNIINQYNLLSSPQNISRTGYTEKELIDPVTLNFKLSGSLHYKLTEKTEAILAAYWGTGNTVYTGSDRYSLKNFKMGQYKLELNNKNWVLRAYTTQENAGESYNLTATTRLFNEAWKTSVTFDAAGNPNPQPTDWYMQYASTFLNSLQNGATIYDAHQSARAFADQGRPVPGTASFISTYDAIRKKPISQNGGLLLDKSDLYSVEGNYNLSSITNGFADLLVGANYKEYILNSQGTLFADSTGNIGVNEFGAFLQASKKIADKITFTVSGRYDKNQNFKGRFTPRITAVIKLKENNNLRLSYQTAYRNPSNQNQWINLLVGSTRLVGCNPSFSDYLGLSSNPLYSFSVNTNGTLTNFKQINFPVIKPESVNSFEIGYKGLMLDDKLLIDIYGYYGEYHNFLSRQNTIQTTSGVASDTANSAKRRNISVIINATDKVKTYGFGFSLDYRLPHNFIISGNIASDNLSNQPADFVAYFNAPEYKTNLSVGNTGFGYEKLFGFNISYRWQKGFYYQADFASGNLPDVHTVDAQVSVKLPKAKSMIKLGATNLLNQYYYNAIGNSRIGGLYYLSFGYNIY